MKLFSEYKLGNITLKNRMVMAPMTRSRAYGNIPTEQMAKYYSMRADAGLLITEGTAPSPNGLGYARIPGLFSAEQIQGWKNVTDAVHENGGKIFVQIMHTGRVSHTGNMPDGAEVVAPSAIAAKGEMWTDAEGMKEQPVPKEMTAADIEQAQNEYVQAAKNAIEAGFDGVELHAANGYLMDQFINPGSNQRTDEYGGSAEHRNRFVLEATQKVAAAIGAEKTGIRLSPYGAFNDLYPYESADEQYVQLSEELGKLGLVYLHLIDHSSMGAPEVPQSLKDNMKKAFGGAVIYCGGLTKDSAEELLQIDDKNLTAFGKPFIGNPDLVKRMEVGAELTQPDFDKLYTPGDEGYIDYALMSEN